MATFVLTNAKILVGEYNLTSDHNQISLTVGAEDKDTTTFGSTYRSRIGGLKTFELSGSGYNQYAAGQPDSILFANLGVADKLVTVAADGGDEGEIAYFTNSVQLSYDQLGQVGEVAPFSMSAQGRGVETVRGTVMHDLTTARTATGNGTITQVGAVSATQKMYAGLHVPTVSGTTPSLTVKIQSAAAVGFSSPTDRFTFTAATAATSQWATPVAGAITDTYWRVVYTISGTNPSFNFHVSLGIQ